MTIVPAPVAAIGLAIVHIITGKLRFLEGTPRSRWLSIAEGVSVAYVFIHLLPELGEREEVLFGAKPRKVYVPTTGMEHEGYNTPFLRSAASMLIATLDSAVVCTSSQSACG
jgi:hypothetical protein